MNIIVVDDERPALVLLERIILDYIKGVTVNSFSEAKEALRYARENKVDVAFLDINMVGMNGLVLAKHLKDIYGDTNIIFVTGYDNYMGDAFNMHASGYLLKPIDEERVIYEIKNLRKPVQFEKNGVRVQCFGDFAVFVDDKLIIFNRPKSKEILAYLVDRKGASVTKKELAAVLWEEDNYTRNVQSHLQVLISDMLKNLKEAGVDDIVIRQRGQYAIDVNKINCDYYNYEKGYSQAVNSYRGEYMRNYSWAEFTTGMLVNKSIN